jgi:hypothetical protein
MLILPRRSSSNAAGSGLRPRTDSQSIRLRSTAEHPVLSGTESVRWMIARP